MDPTPADQDYARYMLRWIEELSWPEFPLAEAELPALRGYWLQGDVADLDAIADRLWNWVDAHGGSAPSDDRRMLLARMLICLAAADNRELEARGYFEELLQRCGVGTEQIAPRRPAARRAAWTGSTAAAAATGNERLQRLKQQVLLAFAAISFVSGATAVPAPEASPLEMFWIVLMAWLIFLWYRLDSDQRGFQRTPGLTALVILVAAVGIPWYLWQSRGGEQARVAILQALGVFLGSVLLSALGAALFATPP